MDYQRADAFFAEFEQLAIDANRVQDHDFDAYYKNPQWVERDTGLKERLNPARMLAEQILPGKSDELGPDDSMYATVWRRALGACLEIRGMIKHRDEVDAILGAIGPKLSAASLHHWVWEEAASAWDAGLRRAAVQSAAARVDRETQVKLRRTDLSGVKLARQAWSSEDPEPGKARLRPVGFGESGSENYSSACEGSRDFHAGAMARIRNLATHRVEELEADEALEQLAALSVLARWIEAAVVVRSDE